MKIRNLFEDTNTEIEPQFSTVTLINYIKKNCQPFVKEFSKHPPIMRTGMEDYGFHLKNTPEKRKPKSHLFSTMYGMFGSAYNKLLREMGHNDRVENVVFGTTATKQQYEGVPDGNWFYLIPVGEYSYTYDLGAGADFNVNHPMGNNFSNALSFIIYNFEVYGEQASDTEAKSKTIIENILKENNYSKEVINPLLKKLKAVHDESMHFSSMVDNHALSQQTIDKGTELSVNIKSLKRYIKENFEKQFNTIVEQITYLTTYEHKMDKFISIVHNIRNYVEKNYVTDQIKSELFDSPSEIYFKTQKYLLVSDDLISYEELMENVSG